ncbi:leucyl/phenylalanyl-tRNA--protein transferase [Candidatus Pseudothioglobus singularis]|jgi:leucyl/phenylalanyl-tRNA--protein transferase|nr:leucyl/phenylalanyl-tRNA--protein transferase [Candidatus Pseudothioglobus singularis]
MMQIPLNFFLSDNDYSFPDSSLALKEPNGLIGIGGDLSIERLLKAYSNGIFPWYSEGEPILWYSPDPRMVITPSTFHLSKSLKKTINSSRFDVLVDTSFYKIITQCQENPRFGQSGTWIDDEMVKAYTNLYKEGYAHSYEVFENGELVGGLYGVALGGVFFGESMFSLVSNASKVAFAFLLQNSHYQLIDCQVENRHLESLGAYNIPRDLFMQQLKAFV